MTLSGRFAPTPLGWTRFWKSLFHPSMPYDAFIALILDLKTHILHARCFRWGQRSTTAFP